MKKNIKNNFNILKTILNKEYIFYLFISLFAINFFFIFDTKKKYGYFANLVFDLSRDFYICILLLIILFFSYLLINSYKSRAELITRFENKKDYFMFLIKSVVLLVTIIYILEIGTLVLFRVFKHSFNIYNEVNIIYNISSITYFIWLVVRNYLYIIFVNYFIVYMHFYYENKIYMFITILSIIIPLLMPPSMPSPLIFPYFIQLKDLGSFINEIAIFLAIYIVKFYVYNFILNILTNYNFSKIKNIKNYFYKLIYYIKYSYVPLMIYIGINLINIYFILSQKFSFSYINILCSSDIRELPIISIATKCISILAFILFCLRNYSLDISKNYCIIFTRISKSKWLLKKILVTLFIIVLIRFPLYFLANFDLTCINDFILYCIIGIMGIIYLLDNSTVNLIILIISLVLFFILSIEIKINILMFVFLFIVVIIKNLFIIRGKK